MKIINREIGYAIKALCFMFNKKEQITTTGELASYYKISRPFLRKILQKLNQVGVVESYKGKRGGFKLSLSAEQILLIDIIKIFQGPIQLSGCYNRGEKCPLIEDCPVRRELEKIEQNFITDLKKISLKTILDR
jgi:Rrf2 family protein